MNPHVLRLCEAVRIAGGRAMLVGGWVRDRLLGTESKDFDLEVYGLEPVKLRALLEEFGQVNTVGEHFSVYKLVPAPNGDSKDTSRNRSDERVEIDVSLPRRESKSGSGHRGFVIEGDPFMTFTEAARRRDFTINAILFDPLTGETVDPYNGQRDLSNRVLRVVAADTFVEDSLRVLRAVQLAARFEMTIALDTASLCRSIELSDLPSERIWGEIEKLLTLANHPSIGLIAARDLGVLRRLFPELTKLEQQGVGCSQDRFSHTIDALDEAARLVDDLPKPKRIAVMVATLCHDLDLGCSSSSDDHRDGAHEVVSILDRLGLYGIGGYDVRSQILALMRNHRMPSEYFERRDEIADGDFRRLAQRVEIDLLYRVSKACEKSLTSGSTPASEWFIQRARSIGVEHGPPAPLLLGRHLIEAGYLPGPEIGDLLRHVYEMQLDGKITTQTEALAAARRIR